MEGISKERVEDHTTPYGLEQSAVPIPEKDSSDESPSKKPITFYLSFLALNVTVFIVSLDLTELAVAVPVGSMTPICNYETVNVLMSYLPQKIVEELRGTTLSAFWANLSFILAVVITQPIYSSVSDVLGRKLPLYTSFLFFFLGSIVFAIANNMSVLIVGRVLQGLGAGGLDVLGEVILSDITTLKERPLYLGLFALPMAGGGISGPIIGAAFSEYVSWRWIGWINLPVAGVGLLLAFFFLHLRPVDRSFSSKLLQLDWIGMLLFTVGSTVFALPLSWAGALYPWSSWKTILPFILGLAILVAFGLYERKATAPIFPYRIFQSTTAVVTLIGSTIHGMLLYSILIYAPLFFQAVLLETPFESAVSILPAGVTIVGFSVLAAIAVEVIRRYRWVIISSWVFAASGVGLWALWQQGTSSALTNSLQVVAGIGIGTLFTVLTIPLQATVPDANDMGIAAGILVSFRLFGGLTGLGLCSTVFNNVFERRIAAIPHLPQAMATIRDTREAVAFIPVLRSLDPQSESFTRVLEAYRVAMMTVFLMLAGLGAVGFVTSFCTKELTIERDDLGRQQLEHGS